MNAPMPLARADDLVIQELKDETLVYDKQSHHANCLNRVAAMVWRNCDGRRSEAELATMLHTQLGVPNDPRLVECALQELTEANLLQSPIPAAPGRKDYSRRELARTLGASAAAFLLAPMVTSILTQPALAQASPRSAATATPAAAAAGGTTGSSGSGSTGSVGSSGSPSDRNLKEAFATVDVSDVLHQLASLPIQTWNYKSDDASIRHIGPMAQDFAAAFPVGADDKHIHPVDAAGVSFAAIQALYQLIEGQAAEIRGLKADMANLQEREAAVGRYAESLR